MRTKYGYRGVDASWFFPVPGKLYFRKSWTLVDCEVHGHGSCGGRTA